MRALLIGSSDETISEIEVPDLMPDVRRKFGGARLVRTGTLPSGDGVHVIASSGVQKAFSLGGSEPYCGPGLVLGKRGPFGILKRAATELDALASIISFASDRSIRSDRLS
jgi:hypothetical protein